MKLSRWLLLASVLLLAIVIIVFSLPPAETEPVAPTETGKPKLAVLLVFDQLRGDYLIRWQDHFDREGFGRLQSEGAWFQNCHYPYAYTLTAPGHASMATGCSPNKHGIIANSWYDRQLGKVIESIETEQYPLVPPVPGKEEAGAAPVRLLQPTVGDALMEQTGGKAKVVAFCIKDRGSILLAALRALLAAWFSPANGMVVTSTYYNGGEVPGWLTKFNKSRQVDKWFGKDWTKIKPELDYEKLTGSPDDFKYEGTGVQQGKTFPHPTTGGLDKPGKQYYQALGNSPFGNDLMVKLARQAIVEEKLGQGDVPDLLCLSFSSNDFIGHCWGPDSHEVLDVTLRTDLLIKDFLHFLDEKIGKDQYLVVLCSDHGVCPLPEMRRAQGHKDAGRLPPNTLTTKAQEHLNEVYGNGKTLNWIESAPSGMIYLNHGTIKKAGVKQEEVEKSLADWLGKQEGIHKVYTRTQLVAGSIQDDPIGEMVQRSFHPERSGDVFPILEPYWLLSNPLSLKDTGSYTTTHGSPHEYDTHVPLLVYGPNVKPGIRQEKVTPQAVASIIAAGLGIEPPKGAEVSAPEGLWK